MSKYLIHSLLWSLSGDGKLKVREDMGQFIRGITTIPLPPATNLRIIDYEVMK
jgi:dynein heavy chain 1